MRDHEFKTTCPHCGKVNEAAGNMEDNDRPRDGDLSMCIDCGQWSLFKRKAKGGLRKPTPAEQRELSENPEVQRANWAWHAMREQVAAEEAPKQ